MGTAWKQRVQIGAAAALLVGAIGLGAPGAMADDSPQPELIAQTPAAAMAAQDDPAASVRVMGRNLYLGAEVGVALELLPDTRAAMQFMWDQVAATDFDTRVRLLAQEAADAQPHVIGLQEATTWACRPQPWRSPAPVYDFTEQFLTATAEAGVGYQVAAQGGDIADNPGYQIPAIPFLTRVSDPDTFQPLFGTDTADCGFVIGDALLVRDDVAPDVLAAGTSEYEDRYAVVPVVFTIDRGYAWADIAIAGTTVRAVTTHLESLWATDGQVASAQQARQLTSDLAPSTVPLIVIGDFNSDPRDPRPTDADARDNPGGQPEAGATCAAQPDPVTAENADPSCSAYWTMIAAGFADAGPDAQDPAFWTWGADGDLAGPNPQRLEVALDQGNDAGFTDRLDYIFLGNGATATDAEVFGNTWPDADELWACDDPSQVATTEQSSVILAERGLAEPVTGRGVCLPTDHAGVLATVDVSAGPAGAVAQPAPEAHSSFFRIGLQGWLLIILGLLVLTLLLVLWGVYRLATRRRRRRREEQAAAIAGGSPGAP